MKFTLYLVLGGLILLSFLAIFITHNSESSITSKFEHQAELTFCTTLPGDNRCTTHCCANGVIITTGKEGFPGYGVGTAKFCSDGTEADRTDFVKK